MNNQILTEKDIEKLFKKEPKKPFLSPKIIREIIEWIILLIVVFFVGYVLINWPTFALKINYVYTTKIKKQQFSEQEISSPAFLPSEEKEETKDEKIQTVPYLPDNRLYIDKINVNAPIIWNVPEDKILEELKKGVAHFQGTSLPDEEKGNVFITGHSSGYWWSHDLYNQVFALLDKLTDSDKIALTYKNKKYTYEVFNKMVVKPTQIEVLKTKTEEPTLSLMTCVPVGTRLKRLIVQAKLILIQQIAPLEKKSEEEKSQETEEDKTIEEKPKITKPKPPKKETIPDIEIPVPPLHFLPEVN